MARDFWAEIYDLRAPADDRPGRPIRSRRAKPRKLVLVRRPGRPLR